MDEVERLILGAALAPSQKTFNKWFEYKNATPQEAMPNMLNWCGGYIYKNLLESGLQDEYLKGIYKHNWVTNNYRLQRLIPVLGKIAKEISITPIKSFGLNEKYFNLGLRSISDFDFFFEFKNFSVIRNILKSEKYELINGISEDELRDKIFTSRGSWSYINGPIDNLDVHWKIFDELTLDENKEIVRNNSKIKTANWGTYREMSNELSIVVVSHHHFLQGGLNYSGLCDLKHLLKFCDTEILKKLLVDIDMEDIFDNQIQIIQGIDSKSGIKIQVHKGVKHRRISTKYRHFIQRKTLRNALLYKIWLSLGAKSKIERIFIKFVKSFSKPNSYMKTAISWIDYTHSITLGSGWHYRYPGDLYQWSTYPDSRILFDSETKRIQTLILELDSHAWSVSIPQRIDCFLNGKFIGTFGKEISVLTIDIEAKKGINELSFRSSKPWNYTLNDINYNWQRLQMPVRKIEIS